MGRDVPHSCSAADGKTDQLIASEARSHRCCYRRFERLQQSSFRPRGAALVFTVRCYKCGDDAVRLVLGGRAILHARCQSCDANLLAEVLEFEEETKRRNREGDEAEGRSAPDTAEVERDPPTSEIEEELDDDQ